MKQYTINHTSDLNNWLYENDFSMITSLYDHEAVQLRSCQAWLIPVVLQDNHEKWYGYLLQSYNTIVGLMVMNDDLEILVSRFDRYSPTTSRQATWFEREAPLYKAMQLLKH